MIANYAHKDGTNAFPGFETIARDSRITIRQVTNIIPVLERSGELLVARGKGPHGTNLYTINMRQIRLPMEKISNGKTLYTDFQRSVRNQELEPSPLPPSGGQVQLIPWWDGTIEVQIGRRKRIPKLSNYEGGRAADVIEFLGRHGFSARIVPNQ